MIQLAELEQGESVVPGTVVARIVNRTRIEVPLRIPASSRALAPVGAAVEIVARDGTHRSQGVVARVAPCGCSAVYGDLLAPHATVRAEAGGSWAVVEVEPAAAPLRAPADLFASLLCAVALVAWEAPHDEPR